jgi:4-diphosphocytidyl-2-C-methyl-D-erythritol kinase
MLSVTCPAKVNLFLAVGPRDARGYHPLRTIFQAVDLADTLEIVVDAPDPGFFCADSSVPQDNTVTKALRFLREAAALPPLKITLHKRIPAESGLGGGSSDAAGLIRAVQRLSPGGIPEAELRGVAAAIGADVPFFLVGGRARAEGYGEKLAPLPDEPTKWLLIVRPEVGCSTPAAYRRLDEIDFPWCNFSDDDRLYNDFVRVAPPACLDLIERLMALGARDATLAGSGSAVFGWFSSETDARSAQSRLDGSASGRGWVVRTLSRTESLAIV